MPKELKPKSEYVTARARNEDSDWTDAVDRMFPHSTHPIESSKGPLVVTIAPVKLIQVGFEVTTRVYQHVLSLESTTILLCTVPESQRERNRE
jgi:hypothetical protein